MNLLTEKDVKIDALKSDTIAIIGYGSQGRAHAMNLHDSGFKVVVGVREGGKGWKRAKADGLAVASVAEAAKKAKLVSILVPDMQHEKIFEEQIKPNLQKGDTLLFAHGFTVLYNRVTPPEGVNVILIAPKSPGDLVRREFERGRGVPTLLAVGKDETGNAHDIALAYAHGLGGTRAGVMETTFKEETETDLFGEQAVLCGGATELVLKGYETLVEAGYQPEVAYFECLHELKLIVDLLYDGGLAKMHDFISETAIYGDLVSGPRIITEETKTRMSEVLKDIQDGTFAKKWIAENESGKKEYQRLLDEDLSHDIEKIGAKLRARMSWLNEQKKSEAA
ncbi:MAG: ketol-acid reductoisomerase [Alphaproteobacteria bacterium]|nr:ketol-acid reductoisomerase [Alphaproteobacteria bacterium]